MKKLAVCFAMVLAIGAPLAHAQDEQVWSSQSGRFSLAFESADWSELETPADDPGTILGIERRGVSNDGRTCACYVSERRETFSDRALLAQENLNGMTTEVGVSGLTEIAGAPPIHSDVATVDGVAVVGATFDGTTRVYTRIFYIGDGDDLVQVMINCAVSQAVVSAVEADVAAFMQTLRIHVE